MKTIITCILVCVATIGFSQTTNIWEVESQCSVLSGSGNILDQSNPIPLSVSEGYGGVYSHSISNNIAHIDFNNTQYPSNWSSVDYRTIGWVGSTGKYFVNDPLGNPQSHDIAEGFVIDMSDSINQYVSFDIQVDQSIEIWTYLIDIVGRYSNGDAPKIIIPATVGGINVLDESKWQHIVLAWNGDITANQTVSVIEDWWCNMWNGVENNRFLPANDMLDLENICGVSLTFDPSDKGHLNDNKTIYIRNLTFGALGLNNTNFSYFPPVNFNYETDSVSIDLMDYYTGSSASSFMAGVSSGNNILVSLDGSVVTIKAKNKCTPFNNTVQVQLTDADDVYTRSFPVNFSVESNIGNPEIGVVTVDSLGTNILLAWERPNTTTIDSYSIFREGLTGVYTKIGEIPFDSVSVFVDSTALVNTRAYKYKISYTNKCGVESNLSLPHKSIHLQKTLTNNELHLNWTPYEGALVLGYRLIAGDDQQHLQILDEFASDQTSYTILNPNYSIYRIETVMEDTITPNLLKSESGPFTLALSNIAEVENSISEAENTIAVYPTITSDKVTISTALNTNCTALLLSETGKKVFKTCFKNIVQIPVNQLPKGVYVLQIKYENKIFTKQIIVE